jgi:hypothetical protein
MVDDMHAARYASRDAELAQRMPRRIAVAQIPPCLRAIERIERTRLQAPTLAVFPMTLRPMLIAITAHAGVWAESDTARRSDAISHAECPARLEQSTEQEKRLHSLDLFRMFRLFRGEKHCVYIRARVRLPACARSLAPPRLHRRCRGVRLERPDQTQRRQACSGVFHSPEQVRNKARNDASLPRRKV